MGFTCIHIRNVKTLEIVCTYQIPLVFLVDIVSFVESQILVDSRNWPVLLVAGPVHHHLYQSNYPLTVDSTSSLLILVS